MVERLRGHGCFSSQPLNSSTSQLLNSLDVWFGLGKADDFAGAFFPLAALFQKLDAFEALQNVPLSCDRAAAFETAMLRHK